MSCSPLHRLAHPMLAFAGLFALASAAVGAVDEFDPDPVPHSVLVQSGTYFAWALLATVSFLLLVVGVAGLSGHRGADGRMLGRSAVVLGLAASVVGFFQNATHAFVQPVYSVVAPSVIDDPPGGVFAVGWLSGVVIMAVGLATLGVSAYRARVVPRPAAALVVVGALTFPVPTISAVLLGAGLLWAGAVGLRARPSTPAPDRDVQQARHAG